MIWSKLKKLIKQRLAESVTKEVDFFMTEYDNDNGQGRAWITINGKEVVNFSTAESYQNFQKPWNELTVDENWARHPRVNDEQRTSGILVEKGEFSRGDFTKSCFAYLDYNIQEAQQSQHPIIRMLAALDRRTGKRILHELIEKENNPLVKYFLNYRIEKG